jgi:hypothetical protein
MDELAREYATLTTRKSQNRFMNWLGGLGRWTIEAPASLMLKQLSLCWKMRLIAAAAKTCARLKYSPPSIFLNRV